MKTDVAFHRPQLYSAQQVRDLERAAIGPPGIPGYELMQRAARASFDALRAHWPQARRLAVLCGPGNNGGDGYEIARLARMAGLDVALAQVGTAAAAGDAVTARANWLDGGGEVHDWDASFADGAMKQAEVICDAIFGIGIARPVSGAARHAIDAINAREAHQGVIAIDLPSGLDADTGMVRGAAVRADLSISFIGRKLGLYTGQGPDFCGERLFSDLQVPSERVQQASGSVVLLDHGDLARALPRRARTAHKGRHGHVLLIGGNHGMAGAILLAARAALRCGAGLVSVATRDAHAIAFSAAQPEAMFHGVERAEQLDPLMQRCNVIAIGPGLGLDAWSEALLQRARAAGKPMVVDADALNLLANASPAALPDGSILTPHPAEAGRLLGRGVPGVQADRVGAVRELVARWRAVTVLKGAGSLIGGERIALCPYGNPGMGVGGMGDILTGVVAGLSAQGLPAEWAARIGVLAHALAGDLAAVEGERGLLPGDLLPHLRRLLNPS